MESCERHHKCQRNMDPDEATTPAESQPQSSRKPTFLIDVRHPEHPKLVAHQSLPRSASYLALSYVWGGKQSYVLTTSTVQEKCTGLDLSQMPQTIRDAMVVAKELGFSFLWVDALCIIQDDAESMLTEIASMGKIYRNSKLTLIAARAQSSTGGFLGVPDPPSYLVEPFEAPLATLDGAEERVVIGHRSYYKSYRDPINARAWTLQERLLSQRCLLYSYDGPKWICRASEINPLAPPAAPSMFPNLYLDGQPSHDQTDAGDEDRIDEAFQKWLGIRDEYVSRRLTNGQDKLPAISAIAAEVSRVTGWTYLAGLWKEDLFNELQWRSDGRTPAAPVSHDDAIPSNPLRPRPTEYRAPSWSWASVDCAVIGIDQSFDNREIFDFRILSCDIVYQKTVGPDEFPFAPIVTGTLVVEGRVVESNWRWKDPTINDPTLDAELLDPADETLIWADMLLDASGFGLEPGAKVCCLAMSVLKSNRHRWPVEGLLLTAACNSDCYRRVGFFTSYSTTIFEGVGQRRVTIM